MTGGRTRRLLFPKGEEMDDRCTVYKGYAGARDTLILEWERRRSAEEKIHGYWRKVKTSLVSSLGRLSV